MTLTWRSLNRFIQSSLSVKKSQSRYGEYIILTARGNPKEADKYIIKDESAWDCIDNEFNQYMQDQNEKYPERKLSNVEILDASFIGYVYLPLE